MRFPKDDYESARKIGIPIFALWIANTTLVMWSLILRVTLIFYYSCIPEIVFSALLYLLVSRNPVPEGDGK